jgi:hypothetical protein
MKNLLLFACCLLLGGCTPFPDTEEMPCWVHHDVEQLGLGYEARHGVALEDEIWECIHAPGVLFVTNEEYAQYCGGAGYSCYIHSEKGRGAFLFSDLFFELAQNNQRTIVRHEALHRLLHCLTGDPDSGHSSSDFDQHMPPTLALEAEDQVSAYACSD